MPGPVIVITQGLSVTTGVPNYDVVTGTPVTFSLTSAFGIYEWQLISRPVDHSLIESGDNLVPPLTLPAVTITPTFKGTYKVRFIADGGVGLNKISELWFYARNPGDPVIAATATLPRRHPAYTEGSETGSRGAMTELDAWLYVIEDIWDVVLNTSAGAGGDLSGPLNDAVVVGLQSHPISASSPSSGDILEWNGSAWTPTNPAVGGDLSGTIASATVIKLQGRAVDSTAPTSSQVLEWDGSKWAPTTLNLTLSGDVTGTIGSNTVVKIQGRNFNSAAPSTGNVVLWDGAQWTPSSLATVPAIFTFPGVTGSQSNSGTGSNTYKGIGCIVFDPSVIAAGAGSSGFTRTIKFRAVLEGTPGVTAQVKLFNVDDAEDVTGTALSVASTTPSRLISGTLTVGGAAGNIKNALRTYEVQLQVFTPNPAGAGDGCTCKLAQLEVLYS